MSRICLFALFLILSIAVRFGDCENNAVYGDDTNCTKSAPGSDKTRLSPLEKIIEVLKLPMEGLKLSVEGMNLPVEGMKLPVEGMKLPVEGMKLPVEGMKLPVEGMKLPVEGMKLPVEGMKLPVEGMKLPVKGLKLLVEGPKLPVDTIMKRNRNTLRVSFSDFFEKLKKHGLIFPGTLWCGGGDIAKNENDLGLFNRTDACCRAHDNCPNDISAGDTEVNLINNGIFTRSACFCDHEFYKCLKEAGSLISETIGTTYFSILQPQCFECTCPTDGCKLDDGTACKNHCAKYEWIDNPKF
ncbi:Phospholipase A2 [Formica fusca]